MRARRVCVKQTDKNTTHLVDTMERAIENGWEWQDRQFTGLEMPVITLCRIVLKSSVGCVEVVEEAPNCQRCVKLAPTPVESIRP